MPGRVRIVVVLLAVSAVGAAAQAPSQTLPIMFRAYFGSESYVTRLDVMQDIPDSRDPGIREFLTEALRDVMEAGTPRPNPREETARLELKRIIAARLGRLGVRAVAPRIYRLYADERDPLLRGIALEALGAMGADEYGPVIADILEKLNLRAGSSEEPVALGAIVALESLREPRGFAPVLFASVGRYSAGLQERARKALPRIVDDPTDVINAIMEKDPDPELRRQALLAQNASQAPRESKIGVAVTALRSSVVEAQRTKTSVAAHARLQATALQMLIEHRAAREDGLPVLAVLSSGSPDPNVRLSAIMALGVNGSSGAARILSDQLAALNDLQERGSEGVDNRIVRALIQALGLTRDPAARPELVRTRYVGYAEGVVSEVDAALARLR